MKKLYVFIFSCLLTVTVFAQPLGWNFTKHIQIQENSGDTVPEYQLKMILDTQTPIGLGEMNADGSDIRFGTSCDVIDLNYWIESGINTTNTVIWVKTDSLFANQMKYIHMFYGNISATPVSSINGTFYGPHSSTDSVAGANTGGVTNSQRGFRFVPTEDILVTHFGKNEPTGSTRYITLFNFLTQTILRQSQVSGPAAQYSYSNISSPIWLTQSTSYVLLIYQGATDGYSFGAAPQMGQHLIYQNMYYCNGCTQNSFPTNNFGGMHYGYVDLWYYTKKNMAIPPTYVLQDAETGFLGPDTANCITHLLDAEYIGANYLWNDSSTNQTLTVTNSGSYFVSGTSTESCLFADTINVVINSLPVVNLGEDTLVCNTTIVLDAGNMGAAYVWNNASTGQTVITDVSGPYFVQVTDSNGCINADTILITNAPLPAIIGSITPNVACYGDTVIFNATGGATYEWTDVLTNGPHAVFSTQGYLVNGIDTNGCANVDILGVSVNYLPIVNFTSPENVVCLSYGPIAISGGTPSGGIYSGTGMVGTDFIPSTGVGTYILSYTYTDTSGCTVTATDDITVLPCLGIEENGHLSFNVYPNPSNGEFIIDGSSFDEASELKIYDMLGKVVYVTKLQSKLQTIHSNLATGIYKIELSNEKQSLSKTIIIK